jgi:glycosyltransferase involved in cell wall biosynthesis
MDTSYISICIPTYKRAGFLRRLLNSIAIQEFKDFEVIVTDDSPNQEIEDLCKEYSDRLPISYYRNLPALGTPENWNEGIRKANGRWIKIMHDDDWFCDKKSLGVFARATDTNPGASFIFSAYEKIRLDEFGNEIGREKVIINTFRYKALSKNPFLLFSLNSIGPPSVTMVRNDRPGFYDQRLKWLVDIDFYISRLSEQTAVFIAEPLINIGIGDDQVTNDFFHYRPVEIPESFYLLNKTGTGNLRHLLVYDAWWRLMRNLEIREKKDIEDAGYTGEVPATILSMISWQRKLPATLLKTGVFSKTMMFLHYLFHRNKI